MKRLAIMQPYFFPYLGYFQLIKAVDEFVVYDDVNFIKQGWITRNKILLNQNEHYITLHAGGISSNKKINEILVGNNRGKLLKTIEQAYKKAPFFENVYPLISEILSDGSTQLSKYLAASIQKISSFLGINTTFTLSSQIEKNNNLSGQDKVIEICKKLKANQYINAIGGKELYHKDIFLNHNIELKFLRSFEVNYKQFNNDFIPWLSIIDILMFNAIDEIHKMLNQYELI